MAEVVEFTVLGEPKGKQRPRFARAGNYVRTYTPEKTVLYENLIRTEYERQCGGVFFEKDVPLDIRVTAYYSIPKSVSKTKRSLMLDNKIRPIKKCDGSNLLKAVEDALNGVAYRDDVQLVDIQVRRFYSDRPRVVVTIGVAGDNQN